MWEEKIKMEMSKELFRCFKDEYFYGLKCKYYLIEEYVQFFDKYYRSLVKQFYKYYPELGRVSNFYNIMLLRDKDGRLIYQVCNNIIKTDLILLRKEEYEGREVNVHRIIDNKGMVDFGFKLLTVQSELEMADYIGGFIQSWDNLYGYLGCFVRDRAVVFGNAHVTGNAQVFGEAKVSGDNVVIDGDAQIFGSSRVSLPYAKIDGDMQVFGQTFISGMSERWCGCKHKILQIGSDKQIDWAYCENGDFKRDIFCKTVPQLIRESFKTGDYGFVILDEVDVNGSKNEVEARYHYLQRIDGEIVGIIRLKKELSDKIIQYQTANKLEVYRLKSEKLLSCFGSSPIHEKTMKERLAECLGDESGELDGKYKSVYDLICDSYNYDRYDIFDECLKLVDIIEEERRLDIRTDFDSILKYSIKVSNPECGIPMKSAYDPTRDDTIKKERVFDDLTRKYLTDESFVDNFIEFFNKIEQNKDRLIGNSRIVTDSGSTIHEDIRILVPNTADHQIGFESGEIIDKKHENAGNSGDIATDNAGDSVNANHISSINEKVTAPVVEGDKIFGKHTEEYLREQETPKDHSVNDCGRE